MGNWYKVIKKINGRLYDYWQRTERVAGSTKTFNKYIGPAGGASLSSGRDYRRLVGNGFYTFHVKQRSDSKYYVMIDEKSDTPWIDTGFAAANKAADNAASHQRDLNLERAAEARAENRYFYENIATPEERAEMEEQTRRALANDSAFTLDGLSKKERRQDERIQYGSLKARKAKHKAAYRKAATRGIKALNPFIAQAKRNK